jgi:hypothetical protein
MKGLLPSCGYHRKFGVSDIFRLDDHYLCFINVYSDLIASAKIIENLKLHFEVRRVSC